MAVLLSGLPLPTWMAMHRRRELLSYARSHWRLGLVGGIGTTTSYAIALWAMTQVPVAMVSALRETSILFALLISTLLLGEQVRRIRWLAASIIVCGAVALRMAG